MGYNLYFNTIQSIQLKHNIHWEFTVLNLGPQDPHGLRYNSLDLKGHSPVIVTGPGLLLSYIFLPWPTFWAPSWAAWDTICSLLFSLLQSLWPSHTWRKSQLSSPPTTSLQAHPSGLITRPRVMLGFPCDLAGKESACNVGDLGSILGLGRSPEEGKGYPLQYSGLENSRLQRVRHHWVTFTFFQGNVIKDLVMKRKGNSSLFTARH